MVPIFVEREHQMKLSEYDINFGRPVAFYPGLKKVTGSIQATLFLCQILYWTPKSRDDGWVFKDHYEIEEETGLSYYEQKTARKILRELGILDEHRERWKYHTRYKVNEEVLNFLWEQRTGEQSKQVNKEEPEEKPEQEEKREELTELQKYQDPTLHPEHPAHHSAVEKKGDWVDGMIDFSNSPRVIKDKKKAEIIDKFWEKLRINIDNKTWAKFVEYVYMRQEKFNEPAEQFISWMVEQRSDGFKSTYYTPDKLTMLYPQAFAPKPIEKKFVEEPPEIKEKDYSPMPDDLKIKPDLY